MERGDSERDRDGTPPIGGPFDDTKVSSRSASTVAAGEGRPTDGALDHDGPPTIGRFVLLRRLGAGGMGVVYSAFDELLDRSVAIKLVRSDRVDPVFQMRMLREAKALARLSHPHVVQIYDVGEHEGQLYLAMELIRGESLRSWLAARWSGQGAPAVAPILAHFLAAGEALAAAHDAGLVHRDFKPDNVLVGDDGRVRVVDFGLALPLHDRTGSASTADEAVDPGSPGKLTRTGTLLGTPVYMAPEQLTHGPSDARADIYAFCVALHEALYGARPFNGETVAELLADIRGGVRAPLPVERPAALAWLRAAIDRGLAADPAERWPTMRDLLAALRADPRRRRRRWLSLAAALALAVAVAGGVLARSRVVAARCEASVAAIDAVWRPDDRAALRAALAADGAPHAADTTARVETRIDAWAEQWRAARRDACASEGGGPLADAVMTCLEGHMWRLDGLVRALSEGGDGIGAHAVTAVAALPSVTRCADRRWLDAPAVAGVDMHRRRLTALRSRLGAGRYAAVKSDAAALLAEAETRENPSLQAETTLVLGIAERHLGELEAAASDVADAYYLAGRAGDDRLAAEAATMAMAIVGVNLARIDETEPWRRSAAMMLARAGVDRQEPGANYRTTLGVLHRRRGELEQALAAYDEALEILAADLGPSHPSIARVRSNRAAVLADRGDFTAAIAGYRAALAQFEESHGPHHPDVAVFLNNLGALLIASGANDDGIAALRRALAVDEATHGPDHPALAAAVFNLGTAVEAAGDDDDALALYRRAQALYETQISADHPELAFVLTNEGALLTRRGERDAARALLERALAIFDRHAADPGRIGVARLRLAQALDDGEETRARALKLAEQARAAFVEQPVVHAADLAEVDAWLAARGAR